jgi:hypothetical protein
MRGEKYGGTWQDSSQRTIPTIQERSIPGSGKEDFHHWRASL